jgi:hypothetical protein
MPFKTSTQQVGTSAHSLVVVQGLFTLHSMQGAAAAMAAHASSSNTAVNAVNIAMWSAG